jgi:hypothetical protein
VPERGDGHGKKHCGRTNEDQSRPHGLNETDYDRLPEMHKARG